MQDKLFLIMNEGENSYHNADGMDEREFLSPCEMIWIKADKTEVEVQDMTDRHIFNCLKLISNRRDRWRIEFWHDMRDELYLRKSPLSSLADELRLHCMHRQRKKGRPRRVRSP